MHLPYDLQVTLDERGGLELPSPPDAWTRHLISQAASGLEQYREAIRAISPDDEREEMHVEMEFTRLIRTLRADMIR